jgi:hypothetical protein
MMSISQKDTIYYFMSQLTLLVYWHINFGQTTSCAQVR